MHGTLEMVLQYNDVMAYVRAIPAGCMSWPDVGQVKHVPQHNTCDQLANNSQLHTTPCHQSATFQLLRLHQ